MEKIPAGNPPLHGNGKGKSLQSRERSATQTGITYRCFLPDLTRFVTVCCAAADLNDLRHPVNMLGREFSPA